MEKEIDVQNVKICGWNQQKRRKCEFANNSDCLLLFHLLIVIFVLLYKKYFCRSRRRLDHFSGFLSVSVVQGCFPSVFFFSTGNLSYFNYYTRFILRKKPW